MYKSETKRIKWDRGSFDELGINILTSEACGVGMRLLCDLTEEGYDLIVEFFGGATPTHRPMNRGKACIMLTRATLMELLIFGALRNGATMVQQYSSLWGDKKEEHFIAFYGEQDAILKDLQWLRSLDNTEMGRSYWASGTANSGLANRHEFTGRVY